MLSDGQIRQRLDTDLTIEPFDKANLEPASVDLHLGDEFTRVEHTYTPGGAVVRPGDEDALNYVEAEPPVHLNPGDTILATTRETIGLPDDLSAEVTGRSTLGRLFVSVHQTAGFIDPGFEGEVTLELSNEGPATLVLEPGLRICQIVFHALGEPAEQPYGHDTSQYQHQRGPTPSTMELNDHKT